jgi:hypothetical protein
MATLLTKSQFRFGVFFLKSQCYSFTDTPREEGNYIGGSPFSCIFGATFWA